MSLFRIGMKIDIFQSCGLCRVFQISWDIECGSLTASSSMIFNSSAGIPSPLLAFFTAMFPKAHLTSHSRMSGSRWMTTSSWLSRPWRPFLYSYEYPCNFLISSASPWFLTKISDCPSEWLYCFTFPPVMNDMVSLYSCKHLMLSLIFIIIILIVNSYVLLWL